jgi:hypothetical protein
MKRKYKLGDKVVVGIEGGVYLTYDNDDTTQLSFVSPNPKGLVKQVLEYRKYKVQIAPEKSIIVMARQLSLDPVQKLEELYGKN